MRRRFGKYLLPGLAVVMLLFAVLHVVKAQQTQPKPAPPVEPARNPFGRTVAGAGIVEARTQNIAVGTALPGLVMDVYGPEKGDLTPWSALIGEHVKAGQELFRVDTRQLESQRAYYQASLLYAKKQLAKLEAMPRREDRDVSKAKVETAKAALEVQRDLSDRARRLLPSQAIAMEEYRQRNLALLLSQRQLDQTRADFTLVDRGAWAPDLEIARAAIVQAEAQLKQIETDIQRSTVRAPVDGVVLQVNVRPGEFVAASAGQALIVLGAIDDKVHVRVDVDEHDIPRFRRGAPARASLRGAPEKSYPMRFVRAEPYVIPKKSLTGDNTERVDTRVLQVIYELEVKDRPVFVGQQMDVFIDVGAAVPNPQSPGERAAKR